MRKKKISGILYSPIMVRALGLKLKDTTRRLSGLEQINENPNDWRFAMYSSNPDCPKPADYKGIGVLFEPVYGNHKSILIDFPYDEVLFVRETYYAYGYWEKRYNKRKRKDTWFFVDQTERYFYTYQYSNELFAERFEKNKKKEPRKEKKLGWYKRPSLFMPKKCARFFLEIKFVRIERLHSITYDEIQSEGMAVICAGPGMKEFKELWESLNGEDSWNINPWVWVIKFTQIARPVGFLKN